MRLTTRILSQLDWERKEESSWWRCSIVWERIRPSGSKVKMKRPVNSSSSSSGSGSGEVVGEEEEGEEREVGLR